MSSPDPTSVEAVGLLRAHAASDASALRSRVVARAAAGGKRAVRALARRGLGPLYRRAAAAAEPRLKRITTEAVKADPAIGRLLDLSSRDALDPAHIEEREKVVEVALVNLELLKGEFRHLQALIDELGMAFAPATGLAGAGARFAELRETVFALERRLRTGGETGAPHSGGAAPQRPAEPSPPPEAGRHEALSSTLFDYVGFERRFRGDPEEILTTLVDRYGALLSEHQPVIDIGCGKGELLGRLAEQGVEVIGIEPDPGMAAEARDRGITVHEQLAGEWLRSVPDGSLGSIITTHVLEHLELDDMIELLELAARKLRPDSVFISETPNPASLIVLGNSYLLDPTHVRPLHPSLLAFLCEKAGFRDVRLRFFSPATGYHLPRASLDAHDDVPQWAVELSTKVDQGFAQLNDVLFGPQDYAVVARTAPADSICSVDADA